MPLKQELPKKVDSTPILANIQNPEGKSTHGFLSSYLIISIGLPGGSLLGHHSNCYRKPMTTCCAQWLNHIKIFLPQL